MVGIRMFGELEKEYVHTMVTEAHTDNLRRILNGM